MKHSIILHIPHSSTHIPFHDGYVVEEAVLQSEMLKLTDWYTDDLFFSTEDKMVMAPFSRIFCDVERFADDAQEPMAQLGMGMLYEKTDEGHPLRNVTPELRQRIQTEYYNTHHQALLRATEHELQTNDRALLLDCHSFSDIPFLRDTHQRTPRPDFCIGTDYFHTPQKLIDASIDFFKTAGYTVGHNKPYDGTIVPMDYYKKDNRVQSIMLEINRKLYLRPESNEKSEQYDLIKVLVKEYLRMVKVGSWE